MAQVPLCRHHIRRTYVQARWSLLSLESLHSLYSLYSLYSLLSYSPVGSPTHCPELLITVVEPTRTDPATVSLSGTLAVPIPMLPPS